MKYLILNPIVVFLLFLYIVHLGLTMRRPFTQKALLICFLASLILSYLDGVFIDLGWRFNVEFPYMVYFTMSFDYLTGPFLYLYLLSKLYKDFTLNKRHLLHTFGFIFVSVLILHRVLTVDSQTEHLFKRSEIIGLTSLSYACFLLYTVLILKLAFSYRKSIYNYYSQNISEFSFIILLVLGFSIAFTFRYSNNMLWLTRPEIAHKIHDLKVFAILCALIFSSGLYLNSFTRSESVGIKKDENKPKYETSALDSDTKKLLLDTLIYFMEQKKPYLSPNLALSDIAEHTSISTHHISQVLNSSLEINFFDFVNKYRVNESEMMLRDKKMSGKPISTIMYECGFNSKSVFNNHFKKVTGMTPSKYRLKYQ